MLTHTHSLTHSHIYTHTLTHSHIYTHTHSHIHTHTLNSHIHTHTPSTHTLRVWVGIMRRWVLWDASIIQSTTCMCKVKWCLIIISSHYFPSHNAHWYSTYVYTHALRPLQHLFLVLKLLKDHAGSIPSVSQSHTFASEPHKSQVYHHHMYDAQASIHTQSSRRMWATKGVDSLDIASKIHTHTWDQK